ncbi:MAG: NADH-ubiquinone oxidoreductase-F iron-sulfur binding region domain-containing protein [Pseudomonadota bacterium]
MIKIPDTTAEQWEDLKKEASSEWEGAFCGECRSIAVGTATCGRSAGAMELLEAAKEEARNLGLDIAVKETGCLGHCYGEPMAIFNSSDLPPLLYGYLTPQKMKALVKRIYTESDPVFEWMMGAMIENDSIPSVFEDPRFKREEKRLLARCGRIDPENILHAVARGCYEGFMRSLRMEPAAIIEEIRASGLRGLGGAGFPTWKKWKVCADSKADVKYLICNADEGDPGAFMDRTILESDPHGVIEGMLIAARAIGSRKGFIYIRREYPLAVARFRKAVEDAQARGLLGSDILDCGMDFSIDIKQGAGAFVCGESTALIRSIEGKRGMPRIKPPRSAEQGLHGMPTVLNNVKTFAGCGLILDKSASWFSSIGTAKSKGTAVFALAGKVRKTGLAEVPMGTTLRDVVDIFGGGIAFKRRTSDVAGKPPADATREFKAVQIGGPSGGWIPESLLDTAVDFDSLQDVGAMMGSGGMVVLDEDNCIVAATRFFLEFTKKESCGKCTFCRIGSWHMLRLLTKITMGEAVMGDLALLEQLARDVQMGSLCNLGKTAPNPVLSSIRHFREEYEAHILEKKCPAKECQDLISYVIDLEKCQRSCDACVGSCPVEAVTTREKDGLKEIDLTKCVKCAACYDACPSRYDAVVTVSPIMPERG